MNTISDLRTMLAQTIQGVKNGTIDTDKAKVINELCKTVVDTAKTEVDYCRVTGALGSGFIDTAMRRNSDGAVLSSGMATLPRETRGMVTEITNPSPGVTRTVHRAK